MFYYECELLVVLNFDLLKCVFVVLHHVGSFLRYLVYACLSSPSGKGGNGMGTLDDTGCLGGGGCAGFAHKCSFGRTD